MNKTKSFEIPKQLIYDAFQLVKANKGSAGVDEVSIVKYESNLKNNLYQLWNKLSSGSYMPPAVKAVEIPKKSVCCSKKSASSCVDAVCSGFIKIKNT